MDLLIKEAHAERENKDWQLEATTKRNLEDITAQQMQKLTLAEPPSEEVQFDRWKS